MTADDMRAEADNIAARRPDVIRTDPDVPADVIVNVPPSLTGCQIAVRHRPYDIEVDIRPDSSGVWLPIHFLGGSVEVRSRVVDLDATTAGTTVPCADDCPSEVA